MSSKVKTNIQEIINDDNYKLCYVNNNIAYFSNNFENQWGDDWDDSPYEHNASPPYSEKYGEIAQIAFICPQLSTPDTLAGFNSHYSVEDINDKKVPWLSGYPWNPEDNYNIYAGISLKDFIHKIKSLHGVVSEIFLN